MHICIPTHCLLNRILQYKLSFCLIVAFHVIVSSQPVSGRHFITALKWRPKATRLVIKHVCGLGHMTFDLARRWGAVSPLTRRMYVNLWLSVTVRASNVIVAPSVSSPSD